MDSPRRKISKRFKDRTGYYLLKANVGVLSRLPGPISRFLGNFLGLFAWLFWRGYRRLAMTNIRIALGDQLSPSGQSRLARKAAQHLVREFLELSRWLDLPPARRRKRLEVEGEENIIRARREGRGVILLTAHLSNFPLVSVVLTLREIPNYFVMKQIKVKMTDDYFNGLEERLGVKIIDLFPRAQCTRECLQALQENKVIVLALDLDAHREGIFVDFFGKAASTYAGPLILARRTGAVLLPAFLTGRPDQSYHLRIHAPLSPPESKRDYPDVLKEYNRLLEDCIRRHPEQYNWIYKRWKTRPPGEEGEKIYRKGY